MKKKRLSPLTISNKKLGNNVSGKGVITPRHENSIVLYFNEIKNSDCDPVLKSSEKELYEKMKNGCQKSKEILIKSNLRFVVSVAKHYQNQGLSLEDLVSEGNLGLMTALDKFNPDLNIKFFSYAVWWIRQSILQSLIMNGKMVRIPVNKLDSLQRVNKRINQLEQELHRKPTIDEIVIAMGDVDAKMDAKVVNNILQSSLTQVSLDAPISNKNGEEDGTLGDLIPSKNLHDSAAKSENILNEIDGILNKLTETERNIVQMYYGVLCDRKYTLEEIGEQVEPKLTRERIRQIKEKAIRKLRNNPKIKELLEYETED